jgi:ribosomal-protein-serine acetyltransferase
MKIKVSDEITLHELSLKSAGEIFKSVEDSREILRKWLFWVDESKSVKDTEDYIKSVHRARGAMKELVLEIRVKGEFAGLISMKEIDLVHNKAEIGYWLAQDVVGKGIMTRSCMALIDYAFDELKLNKIQIRCALDNIRSWKIAENLGFSLEGIERQGERVRGMYMNLKVYSLLKAEWEGKQKFEIRNQKSE